AYLVGQGRGGAVTAGVGGRGGRGGAGRNMPAASATGDGVDLIVHTIATNADEKIAHADGNIGGMSWSPDGAKLAFSTSAPTGASDVVVANVGTNTQTVITRADSAVGALAWTPDGSNLTYTVGGGGGGPIPHYASPPEIGAKLIFVAT